METSVISPEKGGGNLTPKEAKRYFEFFAVGTHREVLLLGDLVEQSVHYVRSKGHKVLCGARAGLCELCEKAADTDDVSIRQVEYYAPAYVRPWREREFSQRVVVFSAAAGEEILRLIPDGSVRGHRLNVERYSQGNSGRFRIKSLDGLPKGFPAMLPPAFDLVPFVRARFGKRQDPAAPLVFLPPFKCEAVNSGPGGRPRPLALSAEDCAPSAEAIASLKAYAARLHADEPTPAAAPAPAAKPTPPAELPEVVNIVVRPATPADGPELLDSAAEVKRLINRGQAQYGPRKVAREAITPEVEEDVLARTTGEIVCGELKGRPTVPFSRNGKGGVH